MLDFYTLGAIAVAGCLVLRWWLLLRLIRHFVDTDHIDHLDKLAVVIDAFSWHKRIRRRKRVLSAAKLPRDRGPRPGPREEP